MAGRTVDNVKRLRPGGGQAIVSLLATAAFQLQAGFVGERLLGMCYDPACRSAMASITSDHTAIEQAVTNLVVRPPASAIDLCVAALARLAGLTNGALASREWNAADWRRKHVEALPLEIRSVGEWLTEGLQ